jgi:toxin YoeB
MNVFWAEIAVRQRNHIYNYWNRRNGSTDYSKKLHLQIKQAIHRIKQYPNAGKKINFANARTVSLGYYSLFYHIEDTKILIIAFWDNRQDPEKLLTLFN